MTEKSTFKLVSSTKASDVIPVNKYVSKKTGITVIIADVGGPLVNGFFCFGEIFSWLPCIILILTISNIYKMIETVVFSDGSARWRWPAAYVGAPNFFGLRAISLQRDLGFTRQSMPGTWHERVDRYRPHLLYNLHCWIRRNVDFIANIFGPYIAANIEWWRVYYWGPPHWWWRGRCWCCVLWNAGPWKFSWQQVCTSVIISHYN